MRPFFKIILVLSLAIFAIVCGFAQTTKERVIVASDKLKVSCEEEASLTSDYVITRDGLIVMKFIGAIKVSGLTPKEAAQKISDQLLIQRVLKRATIVVEFAEQPTKAVRGAGAVKVASELPYREGMKLSDMLKVLEPLPAADLTKVEITLESGVKSTVDSTKDDPELKAGTLVFVPLQVTVSGTVMVLGGVAKPGVQAFKTGMTIRSAITAAGGYEALGNSRKVRLERSGVAAVSYDMSVSETDANLSPGDRIVVELVPVKRYITIIGQVQKPGYLEYRDGMTLMEAVKKAGGYLTNAKVKSAQIWEPIPKSDGKWKGTYDLEKILAGYLGDIVLTAGDRLEIGKINKKDRIKFNLNSGQSS